ncbi:UDP-N-acetylmuramate:L-alanyl-gamma-D-glutamyl-meso-diaminopimelate ligase [Methylobacillus sp.]|uniref:UDP-N-acetylmuramate:L-alanyl-gamma-D-glutamyl- meso-diaminopimelate ligase n=1 Tax=Methylobacillus sp. TaxID=56818 RepID=UPI0012D16054|nr:UDP-N-acetylmuramate:L-alanyl-gamma-D-glutamyl-meso-diaminopimelate ligase [Methylobacillus sp.]MPS47624.1 UDP-N-acetylmuramate:L-alanyl-gamma-D-glutamyl-meso-diaminopimelate ligase [Methylobacillus sp.]
MHIHILGICGTFMGGIAVLAKAAGHHVTGCDANVYPPMSTQLEAQGIALIEGFGPEQVSLNPDMFVVGNVVARGNSLMEEILNRGLPYMSGPQWLAEHLLYAKQGEPEKWVLAVAGTHGKTTTTSMLAWILEYAGLAPGFLIGGVPENFGVSARLPGVPRQDDKSVSPFFVIEADEYDTAFFDKRSKFVHYRPRTVILNNLEFDHADIFPDLEAIETQFHHLVRTVPSNGLVVANGKEGSLRRVIKRGCWTPVEYFGTDWQATDVDAAGSFTVRFQGKAYGRVQWQLLGEHNRMNALAALAAARHAGVAIDAGIEALSQFRSVKRRMEVRGTANGITVYDDFAHHPTAIATTVAGLRDKVGKARILAVLEPRSNTMKLGVMKDALPGSLADADLVFCYGEHLGWDAASALQPIQHKAAAFDSMPVLIEAIAAEAQPGDHILVMSNGGFGGIHERLLERLA